ncbi:MAG: methyltransferase domain-containing protein [Parcubacteria group bacterium]|jgi:predicted SAM-dependent methyltransferase
MKLDICGGNTKVYKDFLNVDGKAGPQVDIVADIRKRLPFKNNEIEEILSVATLEHLLIGQTLKLLKEFNRILSPGGKLTIGVPDLKKICKAYTEQTIPYRYIIQYIYGELFEDSDMAYQCHKSAYDFEALAKMLRMAGFVEIKETPYDFPMHRKDLMIKIICKKTL